MALPKQVQKQLKEVEELERSLTPSGEDPNVQTEPEVQPTPPAEPSQKVVPEAPQEPTPTPPSDPWEQRYKSLKGLFDTEMPRVHNQNKELAKQVAELKALVDSLQAQKPVQKDDPLVTDKDVQSFGEDLIDVQRRVAQEVMRDMVAPLKAELDAKDAKITKLEAMLGKTSGEVNTLSFEQRLEKAVPGFFKMNASDADWVTWLDQVDDFTGQPRRAYAEFAYNQGDVEAVARVVNLYQQSKVAPQQTENPRQVELERQVAPRRSASAASTVPAGERVYTEAEADRLWNRVRELYSAGKNDEAAKIDDELSLAYATGRVRA